MIEQEFEWNGKDNAERNNESVHCVTRSLRVKSNTQKLEKWYNCLTVKNLRVTWIRHVQK
jgi:hypothetical protein